VSGARKAAPDLIRTVLGDISGLDHGIVYGHEHLIIDSPLIADRFPGIHLHDVDKAVDEVARCAEAGVTLMIDAMPAASGRDIVRLAAIADRTGVAIVAATGLHHDRYYGPSHWSNHVTAHELAALFTADLLDGVDEFDYTGPIIRRTSFRAGVVKVATSGPEPDVRDRRNLEAAALASLATGAPVLTHCEGGLGGMAQVELLTRAGVPASSIILSHVDKAQNIPLLLDLAATGAVLELDQGLRQLDRGTDSITVRAIVALVRAGFGSQVIVGTDGARRALWASLGGTPGLARLAELLPRWLSEVGIEEPAVERVLRTNAVAALRWRPETATAGAGQ
jgi:predicted metal-dependent phosphotriesterase family hydrolase